MRYIRLLIDWTNHMNCSFHCSGKFPSVVARCICLRRTLRIFIVFHSYSSSLSKLVVLPWSGTLQNIVSCADLRPNDSQKLVHNTEHQSLREISISISMTATFHQFALPEDHGADWQHVQSLVSFVWFIPYTLVKSTTHKLCVGSKGLWLVSDSCKYMKWSKSRTYLH
jgi:hypothetical protein